MPDLTPITREEMFLDGNTELTPITREEKILAGEDIDVITRREWFLKKYRGGGGGGGYQIKDIPNTPCDIATFTDGANLPMPSLKVSIEPQQDLHGYDAPWVGGAGKNKFDATTLMANVNSSVQYVTITLKPNTTYTMSTSLGKIDNVCNLFFMLPNESASSATNGVYSGLSISVTSGNDGQVKVGYRLPSDGTTSAQYLAKQYQIEEGSTATSFAPYSNICPISGWDEGNIVVSPTTDAEDGTTYTIPFTNAQGNPIEVFGGTLDVVSGELVVTHIIIKANTINWYYLQNTFYSGSVGISADDSTDINSDFVCSFAKSVNKEWNQLSNNECVLRKNLYSQGYYSLCVKNTEYTNATDFKNSLDSTSEITFPIATPQTIQLTPTQVKSLLGSNNVWGDCGQILEGEYFSKEA